MGSGQGLHDRLGLTKAKEFALTGKPLSGRAAADCGLINSAVPFADYSQAPPDQRPDPKNVIR
jgi:enoyl-CoA hydratase/carnithine racemase